VLAEVWRCGTIPAECVLRLAEREKADAEELQSFIDRADATKVQKATSAGSQNPAAKENKQRAGSSAASRALLFEAHTIVSLVPTWGSALCSAPRGRRGRWSAAGWTPSFF